VARTPAPKTIEPTDTPPAALAWSADNCSIGRTLDVLRDRWSFLVLREVFNGVRRFDDMRVRTHIPRAVLSDRLATLVEQGMLRRVPYQEPGRRTRHEYRLTRKGLDLYPVLAAMLEWGDRYLADPDGPALDLVHRDCGEPVHLEVHCGSGHVVTDPRDILTRPGPAARRRTA
jgi:DNA-binding HxlR family transcriptional regulator